jgi:hypothetical protein
MCNIIVGAYSSIFFVCVGGARGGTMVPQAPHGSGLLFFFFFFCLSLANHIVLSDFSKIIDRESTTSIMSSQLSKHKTYVKTFVPKKFLITSHNSSYMQNHYIANKNLNFLET